MSDELGNVRKIGEADRKRHKIPIRHRALCGGRGSERSLGPLAPAPIGNAWHGGARFGTFRDANDDDIVPRLPPTYRRVGRLIQFDESGEAWRELATATENVGLARSDKVMDELAFAEFQRRLGPSASLRSGALDESAVGFEEGLIPGFSDHRLEAYVVKIARHVT